MSLEGVHIEGLKKIGFKSLKILNFEVVIIKILLRNKEKLPKNEICICSNGKGYTRLGKQFLILALKFIFHEVLTKFYWDFSKHLRRRVSF